MTLSMQAGLILVVIAVLVLSLSSALRILRAKLNAEAELAYLGGRLLEVQEEERVRIAAELHDGISQQLAMVALKLDSLEYRLVGSAGQRADIAILAQRIRTIASDLQQVTRGLHPARLQHLGLVQSVRALAKEMENDHMRVEVRATDWPTNVPSEVALSLYRVAQEALHNAAKHSRAKSVSVEFRRENEALSLVIADHGVGFTPQVNTDFNGLGIVSMRQRLRNIGGTLTITAVPGHGTTVHATVPRKVVTKAASNFSVFSSGSESAPRALELH